MSMAMVLERSGEPLQARELPLAEPGPHEVRIRVHSCAVCRTDLHIVDGELPAPRLPLVPGHEIVGTVEAIGADVTRWAVGDRIGVPWLGRTCGTCEHCTHGRENLCDEARFTGFDLDGGFAEHTRADERWCFALPDDYDDLLAAPLLCAGLIGYRAWRMAGEGRKLGLYGFGAAAHIVAQLARHAGQNVYAFTRAGDTAAQQFARRLGAHWAGASDQLPPDTLDAAIIFAAAGELVPAALRAVRKGGVVVCGGIHMSDIPSFPYALLWGERVVRSVANLTRRDGEELLALAPQVPVHTQVRAYALTQANQALDDLRAGRLEGAAVLQIAR